VQGLLGQLTFVRHVHIAKLATGVSRAADFSVALLKTGFVVRESSQANLPFQRAKKLRACSPTLLGFKSNSSALSVEIGVVL
jgi:hypothetical protein